MRLFRQTSNLGLLSLSLWNSPPATPAVLLLTAPCLIQYAPSASVARHHYFSLPRCLPFWLLPLQRMPETSWRSLAVKACPSFCCPPLKNLSTAPCTQSSLSALGGTESFTSAQPISTPKPLQITFRTRIPL